MSRRTATILAIVVAVVVLGGTALAITGQLGPDPVVPESVASPDVSTTFPDASTLPDVPDPTSSPRFPASTTTRPPTSPTFPFTTTSAPATTTTAAAPTTTTASSPTTTRPRVTTTTKPPATTTTTAPPATTTTLPPTTTTTVPPTTTTTAAAAGGSYSSSSESQFVALINDVRAGLGIPALTVSSSLTSYARDWTYHMASTNTFAHSNIGSLLGPWSTVGENIAYGWSVQSMHDALVASPGHYANLTNAAFTHVGVGVWIEDGGKIWTTHVFGG